MYRRMPAQSVCLCLCVCSVVFADACAYEHACVLRIKFLVHFIHFNLTQYNTTTLNNAIQHNNSLGHLSPEQRNTTQTSHRYSFFFLLLFIDFKYGGPK
ncbi:hypothetical protein MTR_8g072770 [Medicago truncatula]|uniref:Transmembrane protein n=1 Tax=Medicago truncatula TaxID=3880 RepID=G7L8L1_MEDTR|nr:hypothetical protein MTR_8g072770 [Medicago truncatula]